MAMIQLRRCRNDSTAVPISRLPPEVLRMIFGRIRQSPVKRYPIDLSASRFTSYRQLVSAMLVCHKWHAIGSQAASLWTEIDFGHRRAFASVLLTRSLGAPIRLCGHFDVDNMLSTVIADNSARICELDLWVRVELPQHASILQSIMTIDMPRVRVLSLARTRFSREDTVTVISDPTAPTRLPALKAILLESFLFVPTHSLPRLTHLHLASLHKINPSSILDLLRNTPALEVLHIVRSGQNTNTAAPQN